MNSAVIGIWLLLPRVVAVAVGCCRDMITGLSVTDLTLVAGTHLPQPGSLVSTTTTPFWVIQTAVSRP